MVRRSDKLIFPHHAEVFPIPEESIQDKQGDCPSRYMMAERESIWSECPNKPNPDNEEPDEAIAILRHEPESISLEHEELFGGKSGKIDEYQNEPQQSTAETLSARHGVSPATVNRSGQYADVVESVFVKIPALPGE